MKKVATLIVVSFAACAVGVVPLSRTSAEVTGKTFQLTVKSSEGITFTACFRFDVPAAGDLTIDGLGEVITYRHGQLDTVDTRFKAVTRQRPETLMFFGEEIEALDQLTGEALSAPGETFVFAGPETSTCVAGTAAGEPSPTEYPYWR